MRFLFGRRDRESAQRMDAPVETTLAASPINPFCIETRTTVPEALAEEWNFTDRSERMVRLGHRLMLSGLFEDAAETFGRAIQADQHHFDAYVGRWEAMALVGRAEQAESEADVCLERFGRRCDLGAARAHIYLHRDNASAALEHVEIATENDPDNGYAWLIAGEVRLAQMKDARHAFESFRQARAAPTRPPWLELRIALAMIEWHHLKEAAALLAVEANEDRAVPLLWVLTGDVHRIAGNPAAARKCYRRAAQLVPQLERLVTAPAWRLRLRTAWRTVMTALAGDDF